MEIAACKTKGTPYQSKRAARSSRTRPHWLTRIDSGDRAAVRASPSAATPQRRQSRESSPI